MRQILGLFVTALMTIGCGELIPNKSENSSNRFSPTLIFLKKNGLPKLDELLPRLPRQLAVIEGVDLASDGLPSRPTDTNFARPEITSLAHVETLAQDANMITVQGFSEVRRLESLIVNYLKPVYEVMGRNDLFVKMNSPAEQELPDFSDVFARSNLRSTSDLASIFSSLVTKFSYTVELGESDILPEFLRISATPSSEKITIEGLFPAGAEELVTGFALAMRIHSLESFELDFTFTPATLSGMIGTWKNTQCAEDLFRIRLSGEGEWNSASISSLECPDSLAALSQLTIGVDSDVVGISGVFSQEYDNLKEHSLRAFLGRKQGFVLQAAASRDLEKLAGAAAVLNESDLDNVSAKSISEFGVGDLLGKYINAKFWKPKLMAQKSYNGSSLSHYQNPAFILCGTVLSQTPNLALDDGIEEIKALCAGEDIPGESYLAGFSRLSNNLKSSSIANLVSKITHGLVGKKEVEANIKVTTDLLDKIVEVLSFRNNIFVGSAGELAFKTAPSVEYDPLVAALSEGADLAASDLNWVEQTRLRLPSIRRDELPKFEFVSSIDGLRDYFSKSCTEFVETVDAETGAQVPDSGC